MPSPDLTKMVLSAKSRDETRKAHASAVDEFLERGMPNVVGLAEGVKWKNGTPTGEPALLVLVTNKIAKDELSSKQLAPAKLGSMQTDVLDVGYVFAGGDGRRRMPAFRPWPSACVRHRAATASGTRTSPPGRSRPACTIILPGVHQPAGAWGRHSDEILHPEQQPCAGEFQRRGIG